jgi:hypothetical protein
LRQANGLTSEQGGKFFNLVNLKSTAIIEIPEGCSKHLCTQTIWPESYIKQPYWNTNTLNILGKMTKCSQILTIKPLRTPLTD